jgi:hypothetical protein
MHVSTGRVQFSGLQCCVVQTAQCFEGTYCFLSPPLTSASFLLDLLFDPDDRHYMFLKNVWLSPNYTALRLQLITVHHHGNLKSNNVNHYFIMHFTTLLSFLISEKKIHLICDTMARLQEPLMPSGLQS